MKRILSDHAYGPIPNQNCFWGPTSVSETVMPAAQGQLRTEVAIVGAGFTGLNAALGLARAGRDVTILEAQSPGWGASARNGGFCCLGGSLMSLSQIRKRYGADGLKEWCRTEVAAVSHVRAFLAENAIDADTHSNGETTLAHTQRAMKNLRDSKAEIEDAYGFDTVLDEAENLPRLGMTSHYHGALTLPNGFGLNPRKYTDGLSNVSIAAGATICADSPVISVKPSGQGYRLITPQAEILTDTVVFATNGYSSEDVPAWLRGRYMPVQSNVLVTRPMTTQEISNGWHSDQMGYTQQTFLHYFRLLPSGQFLFGMRGGLRSSANNDAAMRRRVKAQFAQAFPMWAHVETPYSWHGALAFSAKLAPYVGPIPDMPGAFAAFAYHGNGVAMGSYSGALLADLILERDSDRSYPEMMRADTPRFPLGRRRRALLAPGYAIAALTGR